jgi:hypothetical protein
MIPTVRINAEDFIHTPFEQLVWNKIADTKEKCGGEFMICFHVDDTSKIMDIGNTVAKHEEALQLKTTIKLWEKCKGEHVFLDVSTDDVLASESQYRFRYVNVPPFNVMKAMDFVVSHFTFLHEKGELDVVSSRKQKQKRNDSTNYDYNKK